MHLSRNVLTTEAELQEFVDYALTQEAFSFDLETSGENRGVPRFNSCSWVSLATKGRSVVFSFDHPIGTKVIGETKEPRQHADGIKMFRVPIYEPPPPQLDRARAFKILEVLFFHPTIVKVAHGATFDLASIAKYYGGRVPTGPLCCTITLQWLVNENLMRYGLKYRTKDVYGFTYDDEEVGRQVEKYPYNTVAHYSYCDALYCYLEYVRLIPYISKQRLHKVYDLEMGNLSMLAYLRITGIRMDVPRLEQMRVELKPQVQALEAEIYRAAGKQFNVRSNPQKRDILFKSKRDGGEGLKPWKLTKSAKSRQKAAEKAGNEYEPLFSDWSTDDEALDSHRGNPVVDALLEYQEVAKILNTYVLGYLGVEGDKKKPCRIFDGRIYAEPVQYGAKTGRYCVSGDTLLPTSRGVFRFDEYAPEEGDTVISHLGNECRVLGKIYKGEDKMFRVTLYNGTEVKCTGGHRLWTPDGWKHVRDLLPGDKVFSYVDIEGVHVESGEYQQSGGAVLRESTEADYSRGRGNTGYDVSQRTRNSEAAAISADSEERAESSVFSFQDARQEPDEGKERNETSRVQGRNLGWQGVLASESGRAVRPSASSCDGASARVEEASSLAGCPSHRRGPVQQRPGQPRAGDYFGAWQAACEEVEIREIADLGTMGVWDIEVEGDHSYRAQGMIHHNSYRDPNLQNVPAPDPDDPKNLGKLIRGAFIADEGCKLIVADYEQIELVILAHFLQQGALWDGFFAGIDPHTMTAAMVLGIDPAEVMPKQRKKYGKSLNFAVVYGAGLMKVASMIGGTTDEARAILKRHANEFPEIYEFKEYVLADCRSKRVPHVRTIMGRARRVPEINWSDKGMRAYAERQAFNSLIQGSSADLIKLAQGRYEDLRADGDRWAMKQLLTVHDELVTTAPDSLVDDAKWALTEAMTGDGIQRLISVPLKIELAVVGRWSDAKD